MRYHYEKPTIYSSIYGTTYTATDGLYPTVTIRQIMWALKIKPIPKERWETVFDRSDI